MVASGQLCSSFDQLEDFGFSSASARAHPFLSPLHSPPITLVLCVVVPLNRQNGVSSNVSDLPVLLVPACATVLALGLLG